MFDKHRRRRVLYNDDGDQIFNWYEGYSYNITDEKSFLDTRTTPTFGTHVDTYVWCVGNGADPPWGPMQGNKIWPCIGSFNRGTDIIVEACHEQDMEVWGSLRMNDIHDSFMADRLEGTAEPVKAEHPEYLIAPEENRSLPREVSERYLWTALNFTLPGVQEYRLDFIKKNASAHDFDGYELDFTRFIWDFPLGKERENTHHMTDFVRRVRKLLDSIGRKRGRPYTFVVHMPDSLQASLDLGFDAETWLDEKLVDVLVAGMGYMPYQMKLSEWKALGKNHGIPVYPSINTNVFGSEWMRPHGRPVFHEGTRAVSSYWLQEGMEGLYVFNLFCQVDRNVANLSRDYTYAPLQEIGDPAQMAKKDKLYAIQPVSDRGFCQHGSEAAPLPVALDSKECELPLFIGPDAEDPEAGITIRALARGGEKDTKVWFRINHILLEPERVEASDSQETWYTAEVPRGALRAGFNKLAVWSSADLAETANPVIIRRVFVPVSYSR